MPNANFIELEACVKDCLAYCERSPEHTFVEYFHPRLKRARDRFEESIRVSDEQFRGWANESIDDKKAWRALGKQLRETQRYLGRVNAVGYPDETVLHWDVPLLRRAVQDMLDWLDDHADDVEGVSEHVEKLERLAATAENGRESRDDALDDYSRHAQFRASAFGTLAATLTEFRKSMRRSLGKRHEDYQSIRWPFALAPDRPVF